MEKWSGKIAVITGASSGIGKAILKSFAVKGITVIGLARRCEKIEEISREIEGSVFAYKCDVSDFESIKNAFKWIEEKFGCIHILINNAGTLVSKNPLDEDSEDATNKIINTNFTGLVHCTREAFKLIKKSEDYGIIINMCSTFGHHISFPNETGIYPATKFAIRAFSEFVRQELIVKGNEKIRVTNLSPGLVETNIVTNGGFSEELEAQIFSSMSSLKAENVAETIEFVLSTPYNVNVSELILKPVGEKW